MTALRGRGARPNVRAMQSTISCTACGANLHLREISETGNRSTSETVTSPPVKHRGMYKFHAQTEREQGWCAPFFNADCWVWDIPGIEDRRVSAIILIFWPFVRRH